MPRSKRCLCIDCKPATDKTAMELIMFAKTSPEKELNLSLLSSKHTKLAPNFKNDLDEEDKKLNVKLDSLRDGIKELETELELNNVLIKKRHRTPIGNEITGIYGNEKHSELFKNINNKSPKKSLKKAEFSTIPTEKKVEKTKTPALSIFDKPVQGDFPTWILDQIVHEGKYLDVQMQLMDPNSSMMFEMLHGLTFEGMKKYEEKNKKQIDKLLGGFQKPRRQNLGLF